MKAIGLPLGSHVRLPDGREGTIVYNSLCGQGIKWGLHNPSAEDFRGTYGNTVRAEPMPDDWPWAPDALLREPWDGCERTGFSAEDCVGEDVTLLRYGGHQ